MSLEYRVASLESEVRSCKSEIRTVKNLCSSEIKAAEDRARERRDYWLSATFWTFCGICNFGGFVLILAALIKAHSN